MLSPVQWPLSKLSFIPPTFVWIGLRTTNIYVLYDSYLLLILAFCYSVDLIQWLQFWLRFDHWEKPLLDLWPRRPQARWRWFLKKMAILLNVGGYHLRDPKTREIILVNCWALQHGEFKLVYLSTSVNGKRGFQLGFFQFQTKQQCK